MIALPMLKLEYDFLKIKGKSKVNMPAKKAETKPNPKMTKYVLRSTALAEIPKGLKKIKKAPGNKESTKRNFHSFFGLYSKGKGF